MLITARLFAGLRERAGTGERAARTVPGRSRGETSGARSSSASSQPGCSTLSTGATRRPTLPLRTATRWRSSRRFQEGRSASQRSRSIRRTASREVADERAGGDSDVRRHNADRVARPRQSCGSSTRPTRAWPKVHDRVARGAQRPLRPLRGRDGAPRGRVAIGETSVAIAVSAPHRADALAACKDAIDRLKETAPALEEGGLRRRRGMDRAEAHDRGIPQLRPDPAAGLRLAWALPQGVGPDRRHRGAHPEVRLCSAEVRIDLHRRRRLRAHLGLVVRHRLRASHPRPRARSLRRGAPPGPPPVSPGLYPLPRRLRRDSRRSYRPVAARA